MMSAFMDAHAVASALKTRTLLHWEREIRTSVDPTAPDAARELQTLAAVRHVLADDRGHRLPPVQWALPAGHPLGAGV